jgi:enamine deaminase RidA (YjgF/YER057c/UK114 family)
MNLQISNPKTVAPPDGQFSQAVVVSAGTNMLFISGQVPRNINGDTVGVGDMTAQAEQVFHSLQEILIAHNSTFARAIKATIFVTDMTRAHEVTAVRAKYYGDAAPASTFVEVSALGDPRWLLEVELIAAL